MKHRIPLDNAALFYVRDLLRACVSEAERAVSSNSVDPDEKRFHAEVSHRASRINRIFIRADDTVTLDDEQLRFVGGLLSSRGLELSRAYGEADPSARDRIAREMDLRQVIADRLDGARAADTSEDPDDDEDDEQDDDESAAPSPHTR